jgi:hypothetical protein
MFNDDYRVEEEYKNSIGPSQDPILTNLTRPIQSVHSALAIEIQRIRERGSGSAPQQRRGRGGRGGGEKASTEKLTPGDEIGHRDGASYDEAG